MKTPSEYQSYIEKTLANFTYRYLDRDGLPEIKIQTESDLWWGQIDHQDMKEALTLGAPEVQRSVKDIIKTRAREVTPSFRYKLWAKILEWEGEKGHFEVGSSFSWDFPDHQNSSYLYQDLQNKTFSELGQFRKEFPLSLEKVCTLF